MRRIINLIITLIVGFVTYYFTLPAMNLNNMGFYMFWGFLLLTFAILDTFNFDYIKVITKKKNVSKMTNISLCLFTIAIALL